MSSNSQVSDMLVEFDVADHVGLFRILVGTCRI